MESSQNIDLSNFPQTNSPQESNQSNNQNNQNEQNNLQNNQINLQNCPQFDVWNSGLNSTSLTQTKSKSSVCDTSLLIVDLGDDLINSKEFSMSGKLSDENAERKEKNNKNNKNNKNQQIIQPNSPSYYPNYYKNYQNMMAILSRITHISITTSDNGNLNDIENTNFQNLVHNPHNHRHNNNNSQNNFFSPKINNPSNCTTSSPLPHPLFSINDSHLIDPYQNIFANISNLFAVKLTQTSIISPQIPPLHKPSSPPPLSHQSSKSQSHSLSHPHPHPHSSLNPRQCTRQRERDINQPPPLNQQLSNRSNWSSSSQTNPNLIPKINHSLTPQTPINTRHITSSITTDLQTNTSASSNPISPNLAESTPQRSIPFDPSLLRHLSYNSHPISTRNPLQREHSIVKQILVTRFGDIPCFWLDWQELVEKIKTQPGACLIALSVDLENTSAYTLRDRARVKPTQARYGMQFPPSNEIATQVVQRGGADGKEAWRTLGELRLINLKKNGVFKERDGEEKFEKFEKFEKIEKIEKSNKKIGNSKWKSWYKIGLKTK